MLKGTYVFKQDGQEIGRSENLITTNGKNAILQYLSGSLTDWATSIGVGAMDVTPTVSDLGLSYEIARSVVTLKSFKVGSPNLLVVKGTIAPSVSANIYEVGIFSSATAKTFGERDLLVLTDFSTPNDWLATGNVSWNPFASQNPLSPRVGLYNAAIPANTSITNNNFYLNLSGYTQLDTLDVLVNVDPSKSGQLKITFTDTSSNYSTIIYNFDGSVKSGYQILSQNFSSQIANLKTISSIKVETVGSASDISVDAIKVAIFGEITNSAGIVSRSVLSTPIGKTYGVPLDVEYYLQLS
jgi:hypothetical protein